MGVVLRLDDVFHGESENPMMDDGTGVPLYIVKSNQSCSWGSWKPDIADSL
jgi:hypothetical protein